MCPLALRLLQSRPPRLLNIVRLMSCCVIFGECSQSILKTKSPNSGVYRHAVDAAVDAAAAAAVAVVVGSSSSGYCTAGVTSCTVA